MLIKFRFKNFLSFRDETVLDMTASKSKLHESNLIDPNTTAFDEKLIKTCAIYGANASGKTNTIRAMDYFLFFIKKSLSLSEIPSTGRVPFFLDVESTNGHLY